VTDRRDREQERLKRDVDRLMQEEEKERRAETERRGEELRQAWRQRHPSQDEREKGRT
jgi:hypothetical protein